MKFEMAPECFAYAYRAIKEGEFEMTDLRLDYELILQLPSSSFITPKLNSEH